MSSLPPPKLKSSPLSGHFDARVMNPGRSKYPRILIPSAFGQMRIWQASVFECSRILFSFPLEYRGSPLEMNPELNGTGIKVLIVTLST